MENIIWHNDSPGAISEMLTWRNVHTGDRVKIVGVVETESGNIYLTLYLDSGKIERWNDALFHKNFFVERSF